jgi:hypothetical protein
VWDAASGTELFPLKGHGSLITSVRFSPDGRRILTGSGDTTAKLWDAVNGKELLTLKGHDRDTFSVAFSPDGQRIATGSSDTTAKVWVAASIKQVADWQEEQRVVEQHLADLEQERVAEEASQSVLRVRDSIKQWLILAPIPWSRGQTNGQQALDIEQIPGEGQISPRAGEARFIDGSQIKWREVILTNEVIDFNAILGRMTEQSVAYAVCFIRSDAEQRGLRLLVGSDDDDKVYLNGKQVHRSVDGGFVVERDAVPDITLKAGLNVLVFKVVNETSFWLGSVRFTDDQGNPVKGIKITLDPKGGD